MSKKKKMEQQAQRNDFFDALDAAAKEKVREMETEVKAEAASLEESAKVEPAKEVPAKEKPVKEAPAKEEPAKEASPAWAMELIQSQKEFQDSVKGTILKVGKALDAHDEAIVVHDKRFDTLEDRIARLESWKETAFAAEKAKAEVKAEAEEAAEEPKEPEESEAEEPEVTVSEEPEISEESEVTVSDEPEISEESEPETAVLGASEPEVPASDIPEPEVPGSRPIRLHREIPLRPAKGWRARVIENGNVGYTQPYSNIYVADRLATTKGDVEPFFGWIAPSGEFIREMTDEELIAYGHYL